MLLLFQLVWPKKMQSENIVKAAFMYLTTKYIKKKCKKFPYKGFGIVY